MAGFGTAVLRDSLAGAGGPGDVRYAAPERAGVLDRPVDRRADLYSLGLVLHECLTGRPPYVAATDGELLRRRLTDPPPACGPRIRRFRPRSKRRSSACSPSSPTTDRTTPRPASPPSPRTPNRRRPPALGRWAPRPSPPRPAPLGLVGRERELAELVGHLRAAAAGRGTAVLVEGVAGIGKTRLLDELSRLAAEQGAIVLRGAAPEYPRTPAGALDGVVAGLLALAARDPLCAERLRAAAGGGDAGPRICALLPALGPLLGLPAPSAGARRADPARWSGARALVGLLGAVGRPGAPVLVVLDDCQWADAAVLELVAAWSRVPGGVDARHAALVVAFRPDDLAADHPLRRIAAVGRLPLGPLDGPARGELARAAGAPPGPAAERFVATAAAGNPARAELAAGGLRDARQVPPEPLRPDDLAAWRLGLLSGDARKLLGAGALLGREFSLDLAAAMLGRGDTWSALARTDAERRMVVVRPGADDRRLAFCQDELRQALLAGIPESERRRLHARACDVLAQDGAGVYAAAWHGLRSGDPVRAVPRALAAARDATARQAPDVAELYLRAARRHTDDLAPAASVEIVEDLAVVLLAQGRSDLAEEQLAVAARIVSEPARQGAISASLARLGASRGDHVTATAAAEAAIHTSGGRLPGASPLALAFLLLVELLAHARPGRRRRRPARPAGAGQSHEPAGDYAILARCYLAAGRRAAGAWAALRALHLAEAAGPSPLLVECQSAHAHFLGDAGLHRPALAAARRAVGTATALGAEPATAAALAVEGEILYAAGRIEPAAECFAQAAGILGDPEEPVAQAATLWHGYCDYRLGRREEAREAAAAVRGWALAAGADELAVLAIGLWLKAAGRPSPTPLPGRTDAESAALLEARGLEQLGGGELDAAIDALERTLAASGAPGEREAAASARAWLATALRLAAERSGEPAAGPLARRSEAATRAAVRAARTARSNLPHALRERGLRHAVAGRPRRAHRCLRRSLGAAEAQSAREELAHSLIAIGRVGLATGWADAAGSLAAGERALAQLMDTTGETRPLLGAPAIAPPAPRPTAATAAPAHPAARSVPGGASIDDRLATLLVGGRDITAALSPDAIFDAVREVALPLLQGERVVIAGIADAGGSPVVSGYAPACDEALARVCRALSERAATTRETLAVTAEAAADVGLDATAIVRAGVRAAICAPIRVGDAVTACIYVDRSELAAPFGPDELRLAEFVAGMAGTALENADGFAKVESLSRSLEQRVEERTAQLADSNRQLDLSLQRLTEAFERERASAAELKHQAFHDSLTDLANRALFVDRVEHALDLAGRAGHGVAVLFIDLDDFKTVNDSLGHPAGDELLVAVAGRLREVLRRVDTAARLGGDEFGILLEASDRDGAVRAAERILEALEIPFKLAAKEVFVHASVGIALRVDEEISVDTLLRNADVAMYIAKTGGKRGFEVFEQRMHDEIVRRLELKDDLHRGIELRQFVVHYQPIVDIGTNRIHGLEALIRWKHPVHGMISPLDFVPLAEETGMIRAMGDWVLRTACEATRGWQLEPGHDGERLTIGVNLSARELHEPGLVDCVAAALHGSGLAPADLTLEITESVLMNDTAAAIARLRELKALGVRLAIDDFGTGYSSLSYLKHLPVDIVKIDKEFVDDIARGPQEAALAGTIVALSETLHLKTVAEGIEDADQLRALRRLGCDYGQGYLFAKPMPAEETGALLRGDRSFAAVAEPGLRLLRAV